MFYLVIIIFYGLRFKLGNRRGYPGLGKVASRSFLLHSCVRKTGHEWHRWVSPNPMASLISLGKYFFGFFGKLTCILFGTIRCTYNSIRYMRT